MLLGQSHLTIDARVTDSIGDIYKEDGIEGLFQIILWALAYKFQPGESSFWRSIEDAASKYIPGKYYLILVDGYLGELQRALGGKTKFSDGTSFIVDRECFFTYHVGRGLELIGYSEGLQMLGLNDL